MKKILITCLLLQMVATAFSQEEAPAEIYFEVHDIYREAVSQADLKTAATLTDVYERYPASWVKEYVSVEVIATCDGVEKRAMGIDDQLNEAQKKVLKMADYDSKIKIDISYIPDNTLTHNDVQKHEIVLPVLAESEASFPGGAEKMAAYFKESIVAKIPESTVIEEVAWTAVRFTIDRDGTIGKITASGSTQSEAIDQSIMDAICGMPKWTPAVDSKGEKVAQELEFMLGNTAKICGLNLYLIEGYFLD